ncbi:MAG: alpha/beta hydrolase-fold protein [Gammaproteobacteria bacterium]|nr:alpha/beta hydrolase-fold protein [Gammaproteobacteria bacterium]
MLETIEIDARDAAGTVIWLHGLGADGNDFEPVAAMLDLANPVRFVFPHAPTRAVTINGGMEMRAWYDVDPRAPLSGTADIETSASQVEELVEAEEARGIPRDRVVLAGFSQGGVIALHLGLRSTARFAGIMALSTYVHDHEHIGEEVSFASIDVPILMAHGQMDPMIPIARAITSRESLTSLGYDVDWRVYGMGHQVCPEEIADISAWLDARFG